MKVLAAVLGAALLAMVFFAGAVIHPAGSGEAETADEIELSAEEQAPPAVAGKKRQKLGAACLRDNDCLSRECKKFRCVPRVKRLKSLGESCWFDGDCGSGECKEFKCVRKER